MSDGLLRTRRGYRIRCFYDDCRHWASHIDYMPTEHSVNERVDLCDCCYDSPPALVSWSCRGDE